MIREDQDLTESEPIGSDLLGGRAVTDLGSKLRAIRGEFIACGGRLLTREELADEIAERRGGIYGIAHEEEDVR